MLKKKHWVFLLLLVVFIMPIVLSNYLYRHAGEFNIPTKNRGILINPPEYRMALNIMDANQSPLAENYFEGKWWILILNGEPQCTDACQQQLHWLSQAFVALSKDQERIHAMLTLPSPDVSFENWIKQNNPLIQVAYLKTLPPFLEGQSGLVLMDPLGNIMLKYRMDEDFNHCFKDLKWLLHNSQVG